MEPIRAGTFPGTLGDVTTLELSSSCTLGGITPPPPPPGPGAKSVPAPKMLAWAETMVRPAAHEASSVAVEGTDSVIDPGAVDPWVIGPFPPPVQAAKAATPMTAATKVIFITRTF